MAQLKSAEEFEQLKRGTQIVYTPTHADRDPLHPDSEPGFVWEDRGETVFCRFWRRPVDQVDPQLRTRANSEGCRRGDLLVAETMHKGFVKYWVAFLAVERWRDLARQYGRIEPMKPSLIMARHEAMAALAIFGHSVNVEGVVIQQVGNVFYLSLGERKE